MVKSIKRRSLFFFVFILIGLASPVSATTTPEIEAILNWAENTFPEFFPNHQATQMVEPWAFRFYPSTGIYAGAKNNEVFVLGGPFGDDINNPLFVDTVSNLFNQASAAGNTSVPACGNNASDIPAGMVITQSGDVVNITTNGQCIVIPEDDSDFCEAPESSAATGVSLLSSNNLTSSSVTGFQIDTPGVPNPADSFAQNFASSSCTINVPAAAENQVVNSDICIDVTAQFSDLSNVPGVTISPPVTFAFVGTATSQVVQDCFATDATTISDAFTGEVWIRGIDGSLKKIQ